jgi:methylmalonyl-CoA mutase N-terminal domain/subunit
MLRFHTQTAGSTLTLQQPVNNVVRVAFQALAAVLGGTQSLHTNSRDEAMALPSESAVRLALRTQQIIAHESGVADVVDPLAGSYTIEALTEQIEAGASSYIERIDARGGAVKAIESGYMQQEIAERAYEYQKNIETKARTIVGVNDFIVEEAPLKDILRINPEIEKKQKMKLQQVKKGRDQGQVTEALAAIKKAAETTENLVPHIMGAVKSYATVGEISDTLRLVFGEYEERA